VNLGFDPLEQ